MIFEEEALVNEMLKVIAKNPLSLRNLFELQKLAPKELLGILEYMSQT